MTSLPSRPRRHEAAYTLFEIMLVLGIIAVLVGSAVYLLVGNVDVAKKQRVDTDIQAITTQLKTYEMMNYRFPTTDQGLKALVERPSVEPVPARWTKLMREEPIDPWGSKYVYICPGKMHPDSFDIYSLGPDREPSDDDYPSHK
jgi:general secretion pathway protein G